MDTENIGIEIIYTDTSDISGSAFMANVTAPSPINIKKPYIITSNIQPFSRPRTRSTATAASYIKDMFFTPKKAETAITFFDIESVLNDRYIANNQNGNCSSNALDVLALYIKGQKLLYTESKTYCEQQLNFLMLPAIFISCVSSIFSFLSDRYIDGALIIACLNGFNAFLLSLISYLKLDAKAQAHKTSAYKFDKLESMCEFNSGKFMFFTNENKNIMDIVDQIEADVKEIKETNQYILPESIRYEFSFTYSTNIFSSVKKIQSLENAEIHHLKTIVRQLSIWQEDLARYHDKRVAEELDSVENGGSDESAHKTLLENIRVAIERRDQTVCRILECRDQYYHLDESFQDEIEAHIRRANTWFIFRLFCCDWLKS
jgi:hypothetical protein